MTLKVPVLHLKVAEVVLLLLACIGCIARERGNITHRFCNEMAFGALYS